MTAIISEPITVPTMVPEPPNKLAPPITTAAMLSSKLGSPACGAPAVNRAVYRMPAHAAVIADRTYSTRVFRGTSIPARNAACTLPPISTIKALGPQFENDQQKDQEQP